MSAVVTVRCYHIVIMYKNKWLDIYYLTNNHFRPLLSVIPCYPYLLACS